MSEHLSQRTPSLSPAFAMYLGGVASWFAAWGLQIVVLPTLGLVALNSSATELAILQICQMAPPIFLLLYAGALSDRVDGRIMLMMLHTLAAIPPAALGWMVWQGQFTYWDLIIFALSMGCLSAFAIPVRDAMLTRIVDTNVQRAVTNALLAQFVAQIVSFSLAALAAPIAGVWALLAMQCISLLLGLACCIALPPLPPIPHASSPDDPEHIAERGWRTGLDIVIHSPRLLPVVLVTMAVSIFFIGTFLVSLPLIVRNVFGGSQFEISILSLSFWGGTIASTMAMTRLPPIEKRGLAITIATFGGALCLLAVSIAPYFYVMCAFTTGWGICAGINMAMSRTIVQIEAPVRAKARVMATYNLCFMGGAPLGALLVGITAEYFGPQASTAAFASVMVVFMLWSVVFTNLRHINRPADEA